MTYKRNFVRLALILPEYLTHMLIIAYHLLPSVYDRPPPPLKRCLNLLIFHPKNIFTYNAKLFYLLILFNKFKSKLLWTVWAPMTACFASVKLVACVAILPLVFYSKCLFSETLVPFVFVLEEHYHIALFSRRRSFWNTNTKNGIV